MPTVALSAGHGAGDPGAVYKNLREDVLTIKITDRAAQLLREHGVGVLDVPDNLSLIQTIKWINDRANQIDLCVEIHINAGGGTGVEGWNYAGEGNESDKLSQFLADAMSVETGLKNRGVKDETTNLHGRLGFVHDTKPLAVLVECGFIDGDYEFLSKDENLTKMAKGIVRGIVSYLGLPWKPVQDPAPQPPTNDNLYRIIYKGQQLAALKDNPITKLENYEELIKDRDTWKAKYQGIIEALKALTA